MSVMSYSLSGRSDFVITTSHVCNTTLKVLRGSRPLTALCQRAQNLFKKPSIRYATDLLSSLSPVLESVFSSKWMSVVSKMFHSGTPPGPLHMLLLLLEFSLLLCSPCQLTYFYTCFMTQFLCLLHQKSFWCPRVGWSSPVSGIQQKYKIPWKAQWTPLLIFSFKN